MLNQKLFNLCKGNNFAALTTLFPSGHPQTQIMWVDCDDEHVIINTERHRTKYQNIERDPRVTLTIWDNNNPYTYIEVRGRVVETIAGLPAREHIDMLSKQYLNTDYQPEIVSERVIVRIKPDRFAGYG